MRHLILLPLALLLAGCLKTAAQVQREQRLENMSQQLSDSQNIVADLTVMLKNLQTQIDQLNGKVEELQHQQANNDDTKLIKDQLVQLSTEMKALAEGEKNQSAEMAQQRAFIEKVTDKLGKMGTQRGDAPASNDGAKKKPKEAVAEALGLIKKKKHAQARETLERVDRELELGPADRNKVWHALGILEQGEGKHEKALVYFSKIYTKYPQSSLAPSSLAHIAESLEKLGKKEEAAQAREELRAQYPDSPLAKKK
jgi:TolA-binding protein